MSADLIHILKTNKNYEFMKLINKSLYHSISFNAALFISD